MSRKNPDERLIVVSNRLPFVLQKDAQGQWQVEPGSGGLVTALLPVLRNRGGMWIGWPGTVAEEMTHEPLDELLGHATVDSGYTLKPVMITADEKSRFYHGFSNEVIWPLFHDLQSRCNFDPGYWRAYETVNCKFAEVIAANCSRNDFIWVHDYHLMHVAQELRRREVQARMAFFLHIPFPPLDIFVKLPWRFQVLHALLEYDLLGFQTLRDRRNFLHCVRTLTGDTEVQGKGQVVTCRHHQREVRVGAFPVSIDYQAFARHAATPAIKEKAARVHEELPHGQIILGIDRLDYTKGILERFEAFRHALLRYPELHERVVFMQVVVPSREDIPEYHELKTRIERLVGQINGQFTRSGWVPLHYIFRSLNRDELLSYYRAAEIALITPLKDGMNLVAKEYCAASVDEDCVLILSEFAGAAPQLQRGALLVNPYHVEEVADTIRRAFHMPPEERRMRMRKLRRAVRENDIFWWVDSFLRAAIARDLEDFPLLEDYIPKTDGMLEFPRSDAQ